MDYRLLNGANLSYIGDAYYELEIRKYLLSKNITRSKDLRKISINYVSAHAHAKIYNALSSYLTEEEHEVFLRGRNKASHSFRKNVDMGEYLLSSGFEAIIGYLYLKEDYERLSYIIKKAIETVEQ